MIMKLSPDSPELTAYLLDELPPAERALVETALGESEELRIEVERLRDTTERLVEVFVNEPATALTPEQRRRILAQDRNSMVRNSAPSMTSWSTTVQTWCRNLRAHWAWTTTTALAALAMTLIALRPERSAEHRFQELRYQLQPPSKSIQPGRPESKWELPAQSPAAADAGNHSQPNSQESPVPLAEVLLQPSPVVPPAPAPSPVSRLEKPSPSKLGASVAPVVPKERQLSLAPASASKPVDLAQRGFQEPQGRSSVPRESLLRESLRDPLSASVPAAGRTDSHSIEPANPQTPALSKLDASARRYAGFGELADAESYTSLPDNAFKSPAAAPLSTFSLDVDTASYANIRRFLREGFLPPADAVRIEELINYFHYDYPQPKSGEPFGADIEIADCPWREGNKIVRIGLQARRVDFRERPRANLIFLLDVSGSMKPENKLPLVQRSLRLLLDRLGERDAVGIVTYAGESRVALEPTQVTDEGRQRIRQVIDGLRAGSGTAGSVGIQNAYSLATNHFIPGGVNRVILCTDGDFNIGITDPGELHALIEERARSGVFLSVLGFGMGNLKDSTMEMLADKGNGNYSYVDSYSEARKVFGEQLEGTLITVAKDVKVQVEFNPARVRSYRLIGYENRLLRDRDFNDDTKDAGEVGAGHQVTVLYEIEPLLPNLAGTDPLRYSPTAEAPVPRLKAGHEGELLNLKIRFKAPDGEKSQLIERPVLDGDRELVRASPDFKFAAAVAGYGMLLKNSPYKGDWTWDAVLRLAEQGVGEDREGYRSEFVDLARKAQRLSNGK